MTTEKKAVTVRVPVNTLAEIQKIAARKGLTQSGVVNTALSEFVTKELRRERQRDG